MTADMTHDVPRGAVLPPHTRVHKLLPGTFHVATADEVISTLLGSCVAACIYDPLRGIGGMNHFLLPDAGRDDGAAAPASISNR